MTLAAALSHPAIDDICIPPGWGRETAVVIIPARNEAARIGACLAALSGQKADVLVIANNCTDETAARARQAGAAVIACTIPAGGVGAARRLGMAETLNLPLAFATVFTTDADCLVAPDWIEANRRHLNAGADAVCGLVLPIAEEHAALPEALRRRAALEDRFLELKAELERRIIGHASHQQTPGASLAFARTAYLAAGGFDPLPSGEDRAIVLRLKAGGHRIVHSRDVKVWASCRLSGRAPGGMAVALRQRAEDPRAPLCPDIGRSDVASVAVILEALGPLHTPADLPRAIRLLDGALQGNRLTSPGSMKV